MQNDIFFHTPTKVVLSLGNTGSDPSFNCFLNKNCLRMI